MRYVVVGLSFSVIAEELVILTASTADDEPLDQRIRKACGAHAFLNGGNIVGRAPKLDDLMFQVGDGKGGAWIAVTRLSDGTGIQQIAARGLDAQRSEGFAGARANLENLELRVLIGETTLVVGVPEESNFGGGVQQALEGLRGSEDVFVLIVKRAVNKHDDISRKRHRKQ